MGDAFEKLSMRAMSFTNWEEHEMKNKAQRDPGGGKEEINSTNFIDKLRLVCLSQGFHGIVGLGKIFRQIDRDEDNTINLREFWEGLKMFGFDPTVPDLSGIFRILDPDNTGGVDIDKLLAIIRPPINKRRQEVIRAAFEKMDANSDGQITVHDLKQAYSVKYNSRYINGEESKESIIKKLLSNFENNGRKDGIVTYDDFMNYYSAVSSGTEDDTYFDLMMRNSFKL